MAVRHFGEAAHPQQGQAKMDALLQLTVQVVVGQTEFRILTLAEVVHLVSS